MRKKTHDEYVAEVAKINPNIEVVGIYIDAKTAILHRCKIDGHEWEATPNNILRGRMCPACSGIHVVPGKTDLQTLRPDLMAEWNFDKNMQIGLDPNQIKEYSNQKAWWICKYGHEWQAVISSRSKGIGCPICAKEKHSSNPEIKLYFYLKKYFSDAISCYTDMQNGLYELDIYIPSINFGIEYDGERWHTDVSRDKKKDKICHSLGINLVRVREPKCPKYKSSYCTFVYLEDLKEGALEHTIKHLLKELGVIDPHVCFEEDFVAIESLVADKNKENSLAVKHPNLASQWHPTKNGTLSPNSTSCHSSRAIWWLCGECGNEWKAKISSRSDGSGCPVCARVKTIQSCVKPVYCQELNAIFGSISDASKNTNISVGGIHVCCNGIRKSAGKHPITKEKLHWFYVYDQIKKDGSIIRGAISLGFVSNEDIERLLVGA